MPYQQYTCDNAKDVLTATATALKRYLDAGLVPVLLVPSPLAVTNARRTFAGGSCAFGVRVETVDSWISACWELFGDGRRIVASGEREIVLQRALEEASFASAAGTLRPTPGTAALLSRLAREALPLLLDTADANRDHLGLSAAERMSVEVLRRYDVLLGEQGLCEVSQAAFVLAGALVKPPPLVLAGFDRLPCTFEYAIAKLSKRTDVVCFSDECRKPSQDFARAPEVQTLLERLFKPMKSVPVIPTGAVRFLLPAGRYAAPALIVHGVVDATVCARERARSAEQNLLPVVVVARDPHALFGSVGDALAARGVSSAVVARHSFADTAFGRAFLALLSLAFDNEYHTAQASDFALSAFSGISWRAACDLDAAWRSDRTVDRARILSDLAATSESAAAALDALAQGEVDEALEGFEDRLRRRSDLSPAWRSEQLAAVSCARTFVAACGMFGANVLESRPLLERAGVSANAAVWPCADREDTPEVEVLFMTLAEAAQRSACSCSTLVLCDLTASNYPVRAVEDGATLLTEKAGLCAPVDALTEARRTFFRALSSACDAVVLERVLNTENADEAYPAVMYEELLDCYQSSVAPDAAIDRATGLPTCLVPFALQAGEERLQANLALPLMAVSASELPGETWDIPASNEVSASLRQFIVVPRQSPSEVADGGAGLLLSPSALESYLECPYKWFALRRLRLSEPDAGFGPLEMGSFSHSVLKSFYEHFRETSAPKVREDNLAEARELMRDTYARHGEFQRELKRNRNPLIALTKFEEAEAAVLEKKLVAYLDREVCLLPEFVPTYFEFEFGSAEPFVYAGCLLRGSIDRIDVNAKGQAVVIDYKGSISADYALSSWSLAAQAGEAPLPHKVQALMYAQVVRRILGLDVVGAIYVSYGRDRHVSGAIDRTVLGEESLPGLAVEECGVPSEATEGLGASTFLELLDLVEDRIFAAAHTLASGAIGPDPRGKNPCGYCPVLTCEKRRES